LARGTEVEEPLTWRSLESWTNLERKPPDWKNEEVDQEKCLHWCSTEAPVLVISVRFNKLKESHFKAWGWT
jgi:hypothetical protein